MDKRGISNLGDEIKDIIQNAVSTKDFHQLNRDISNTVNSALDEVRRATGTGNYSYRKYSEPVNKSSVDNQNNAKRQESDIKPKQAPKQTPIAVNMNIGKVSGVLFTVFGSIGTSVLGIAVLVLGIVGQALEMQKLFGTIILGLLPLLIGSFIMSIKGASIRNRGKRLKRYIGLLNGRNYCMVKELSDRTGFSKRYVIKDIRKMINLGIFHEGYLDEQDTCLMLNKEAYDQYLIAKENLRLRQSKELQEQNMKSKQVRDENTLPKSELEKALIDGKVYINEIQKANDAILDEVVSKKLDRMEQITTKIFHYVESHPTKLKEIRKFMEYYLPTTLKLLNAYKEFDKQPIQGENITTAKNEINNTLDTINLAFENLLDDLFEDEAMDVSTDISVLETILMQEGLTEKEFAGK